jgi:hypothetical protein
MGKSVLRATVDRNAYWPRPRIARLDIVESYAVGANCTHARRTKTAARGSTAEECRPARSFASFTGAGGVGHPNLWHQPATSWPSRPHPDPRDPQSETGFRSAFVAKTVNAGLPQNVGRHRCAIPETPSSTPPITHALRPTSVPVAVAEAARSRHPSLRDCCVAHSCSLACGGRAERVPGDRFEHPGRGLPASGKARSGRKHDPCDDGSQRMMR